MKKFFLLINILGISVNEGQRKQSNFCNPIIFGIFVNKGQREQYNSFKPVIFCISVI